MKAHATRPLGTTGPHDVYYVRPAREPAPPDQAPLTILLMGLFFGVVLGVASTLIAVEVLG